MFHENLNVEDFDNVEQSAIAKLSKDLRSATSTMTAEEARYLVDYYYTLQNDRIRAKNRMRAFSEGKEPHEVIVWLSDNTAYLEKQIKLGLQSYAESDFVGRWCLSVPGIGPVITAGLLAHIDINQCPNVGHIRSFAGIAANAKKWEKGQKRPFNAKLKTLTWKIGESFVKVSGRDNDYYGKLYVRAKAKLTEQNENGKFAADAERILTEKKFGKTTDAYAAYSSGKLPPAHIHARAKRFAVNLFLSHFWEVSYRHRLPNNRLVKPYAVDVLGHQTYIPPFNNPFPDLD